MMEGMRAAGAVMPGTHRLGGMTPGTRPGAGVTQGTRRLRRGDGRHAWAGRDGRNHACIRTGDTWNWRDCGEWCPAGMGQRL